MDTLSAFTMGEAHKGARIKVFDWNKAAALIKERKPEIASAGLGGDWEYTGGEIYRGGKPVDKSETYTYLASNWARPELDLDGETIDCYTYQDESDFRSGTYWPESALKILNG